MEKLAQMKLSIASLPFGSQQFDYHVDGKFFNEIEVSEVRSGSVDVAISVTHTQEGIYDLDFVCNGVITIPCDRCLDDMEHIVDTDYELCVRQEGDEFDDSRDHLLVVPAGWRELDMAPIVRDTVLLTLPLVHTHASEEQCDSAMMERLGEHRALDLDDAEEPSENRAPDPRWAALRKFTENK